MTQDEFLQKLARCPERGDLDACVEEAAKLAKEMGIEAKELLKRSSDKINSGEQILAHVLSLAAARDLDGADKARAFFLAGLAAQMTETAENIELAISHYNRALEVYTREAFPEKWALTQNNLGNAFNNRIRGDRAENIEQAISHYNQALEVYTRDTFPEKWATTQNNLATAYSDQIRGDQAENIEQAISHYNQALEVYTRLYFPTFSYIYNIIRLN